MSREYTEQQIKNALKQSGGHPGKARQQIIAKTYEDHKLLLGLTQGHLTGIVSLWVNRVITKMAKEPEPVPEEPETLDMEPDTFGKAILSAMQDGKGSEFGLEAGAPRAGKKQASKSHIDTMKFLAQQSKTAQTAKDAEAQEDSAETKDDHSE